ncbi:histone H1 [Propylenella binzhouense]|nr:histone H1 [Propylenella binzhouense]
MTALDVGRGRVHIPDMTARIPKRPRDTNQLAKRVVDIATGEAEDKKPLASARKGGLKGAKARMKALTPEQRSEIARTAAAARWKKAG